MKSSGINKPITRWVDIDKIKRATEAFKIRDGFEAYLFHPYIHNIHTRILTGITNGRDRCGFIFNQIGSTPVHIHYLGTFWNRIKSRNI